MSPRKLTAADKKAIVSTYRSSADSMAVLAARYGVSNSTVSRLLKNNIPEVEYESLIADKRSQRGDLGELSEEEIILVELTASPKDVTQDETTTASEELPERGRRRVRRRSSATDDATVTPRPITKAQKAVEVETEEIWSPEMRQRIPALGQEVNPLAMPEQIINTVEEVRPPEVQKKIQTPARAASPLVTQNEQRAEPEEEAGLIAVASIFNEEMGDLLDDDDEDFVEEDGWPEMADPSLVAITDPRRDVQPLSAANLPRTCYIVVDRFAELVACPLGEVAAVGSGEAIAPQNTLPVFDNHRVAKRFSNNRNQRVIKVPDSRIFQKTTRQLVAKGINLLLVDGQVYSLN
jgi:transposase-like protein